MAGRPERSARKKYSDIAGILLLLVFILGISAEILDFGLPKEKEKGMATIVGKVLDKATSEPIEGAEIVIKDTSFSTFSDRGGNYVISNVPEGYYELEGFKVGYNRVTIKTGIESGINNIDIVLEKKGENRLIKYHEPGAPETLRFLPNLLIFALLGGIFSVLRKFFWAATVCAGLSTGAFFLIFVGPLLSLAALILILLSKEDFR